MLGICQSFIPHLARLKSQVSESSRDPARTRAAELDLQQLPYNLNATYHWLSEIVRLQSSLAKHFTIEAKPGQFTALGIGVDVAEPIAFATDAFLDAARRSQNALTYYVSKALRISVPGSLSDVVKRLKAGKLILPTSVAEELVRYWEQSGARLKAYRDLAQHHVVVSSDLHLFVSPAGQLAISLKLPSNPDETHRERIVYGRPPVHVLPFAVDAFCDLLTVVYRVTEMLLTSESKGVLRAVWVPKEPLSLAMTGHLLPSPDLVDRILDDWKRRIGLGGPAASS